MYIMCVCLFSALSSRVGALQISIIIIIIYQTMLLQVYDQICACGKMKCFNDDFSTHKFNCTSRDREDKSPVR